MIIVDQAPGATAGPGAAADNPYPLLKRTGSYGGENLGGKFALPIEFDTRLFVGGFYEEGQQAHSMTADQPLAGSNYTSVGWTVWKYPEEVPTGEIDQQSKKPKMRKHPEGGKPHKVAGQKPGENYVLMCRSAAVQAQVNHAYGVMSIEQMTAEANGETLSGPGADDPGMLTDARLRAEIGAERDAEQLTGRSSAVHGGLPASGRLERPVQRVSR